MSERGHKTTAGGREGVFHTTHWTEIFEARSEDEPRRQAALEELLGSYWKPVYCWLRRKGHPQEEAKDLTQGFFHEVVLRHGLIRQADSAKGRFRTFLLTALEHYAVSVHRAERAKQRTPDGGLIRLEGIDGLNVPEPAQCGSPEEAFDYAWASALLDEVLTEVAEECHRRGKETHWEIFQERVLKPIMDNAEPPSLPDLCRKCGIPNEARVSKMTIAVKRRFRGTLRRRVRQFVDSDAEVEDEIHYLMRIFSERSGRSGQALRIF